MRARFPLILLACSLAAPALADKKLDPDPAFLAKARTAATATVEPHYDLVSEKVPFWARFLICAGQLTAARDEGRALPVPQADLDRLIADYRARAAELLAYRQKADAKAPATDADAEIAKIRSGAMQFLPADTTKLGVENDEEARTASALAFCQLTRDWYEVQNGIRTATPAADQQKLTAVHDEAMRKIAAEAPKPPKVPTVRTDAAGAQAFDRAADGAHGGAERTRCHRSRPQRSSCRRRVRRPEAPIRRMRRSAPTSRMRMRALNSPAGHCGRRSPNAAAGWT